MYKLSQLPLNDTYYFFVLCWYILLSLVIHCAKYVDVMVVPWLLTLCMSKVKFNVAEIYNWLAIAASKKTMYVLLRFVWLL